MAFRGEYDWNPQGGVIHWKHHDHGGQHPGGWLKHQREDVSLKSGTPAGGLISSRRAARMD